MVPEGAEGTYEGSVEEVGTGENTTTNKHKHRMGRRRWVQFQRQEAGQRTRTGRKRQTVAIL